MNLRTNTEKAMGRVVCVVGRRVMVHSNIFKCITYPSFHTSVLELSLTEFYDLGSIFKMNYGG